LIKLEKNYGNKSVDINEKTGLGSSAAMSVAMTASFQIIQNIA